MGAKLVRSQIQVFRIRMRDSGVSGQKASGPQGLVLEIRGPGNLRGSGIGAPKDQEMTEKAEHHSLGLVSIPDLKEGAFLPQLCPPRHP